MTGGRRPRIAVVGYGAHDHGGAERVVAELLRRGSDRFDFVLVSAELAPELRPYVADWRRVPAPRSPWRLKAGAFLAAGTLAVARARADLVHTMGPAIVASRADVVTVNFLHAAFYEAAGDRVLAGSAPLWRLARTAVLGLERRAFRPGRAPVAVAVSAGTARDLERHYPGVRVLLAPAGADAERFRPDPAGRTELRAALGVGEEEVVALFVGGDWGPKGLEPALRGLAAASAGGRGPGRLWVAGAGPSEGYLRLAAELGVAERVQFLGVRRDLERFYRAADLFLLPTVYENSCLAAWEAAASGLPLVATRVNGIEDLLAGEAAGIAVTRDPAGIAAALERLAADPALRAAMGAAGRQRALGHTWAAAVAPVLALYDELLARGPGGRQPAPGSA